MKPISHRRALASIGLLLSLGSFAIPPLAAGADQTIHLAVRVVDDAGKPITNAMVNVYQSQVFLFRRGVVVPQDYQQPTNAQGLARIDVQVKSGEALDLAIEVAREDMRSESRNLEFGKQFPTRPPLVEFTLKRKGDAGGTDIVNAVIEVKDKDGPLEGAAVLILDASIGAKTGRFPGVTGADGRATIPVWYTQAGSSATLGLTVSRTGYKKIAKQITLTQAQIGKTVTADSVTLEKTALSGAKVTITLLDRTKTDKLIGDASVILDGPGYYPGTTDGNGTVTFVVEEIGTFAVRISHDYYRDEKGEFRLLVGEREKLLTFDLEPKAKKDEGEDTLEVTVLKKDPTDEKSQPAPLPGAYVKAGTIGANTDSSGKATLVGVLAERQEVTVQAEGYQIQTKTVAVTKPLPFSKGKGRATFALDPDLAESNPIRLIVEVRDPSGARVHNADVDFLLANGVWVFGRNTKTSGEADFRSSDVPGTPLEEIRKGLALNVTATGYEKVLNRGVPADLLKPALAARAFTVQLEKDWSELTKAITGLEDRVAGWKSAARSIGSTDQTINLLSAKCAAARGRVEALLAEMKNAQKVFDAKNDAPCKEAAALAEKINSLREESLAKEQSLRSTLDEAIALAARCTSKAEGDIIVAKHSSAIRLTAEIGRLEKQAQAADKSRGSLALALPDFGPLQAKLQETADKIEAELSATGKDAAQATNDRTVLERLAKSLPGRRVELLQDLDRMRSEHHVREYDSILPSELRKRLQNLDAALAPSGSDVSVSFLPSIDLSRLKVITETVSKLQEYKNEAAGIISAIKGAICEIKSVEYMVTAIGATVVGASIELGAAADLPAKAQACGAAETADTITVPDVTGYDDAGKAVEAAKQAGFTPKVAASTGAGSTAGRIIARQDPLPNTVAKRGDPLTIYLNQKLAEKKSTTGPTPTPTAVAAVSPSPSVSDDRVMVPSIAAGSTVAQIKAALLAAGLTAAFDAKGGNPLSKDLELKATGASDPAAGTKVARGSPVTVSIYQKFADETATTTSPAPTAPPLGPGSSGTMPDLNGLTLDQAVARLTSKMRIGSTDVGTKPTAPEKALTIYGQNPLAGSKIDPSKEVVVSVKIYGEAAAKGQVATGADPYSGTWSGVTVYKSGGASEITISKAPEDYGADEYLILAQGHTDPYPAKSDGTTVSHQFGLYNVSYNRTGAALHGTYRFKDYKGVVTTTESTLQRK